MKHVDLERAIRAANFLTGDKSVGFTCHSTHISVMHSHKSKKTCRVNILACQKEAGCNPTITNKYDGQNITLACNEKTWHATFYNGVAIFYRVPVGVIATLSCERTIV